MLTSIAKEALAKLGLDNGPQTTSVNVENLTSALSEVASFLIPHSGRLVSNGGPPSVQRNHVTSGTSRSFVEHPADVPEPSVFSGPPRPHPKSQDDVMYEQIN